MPQSFHWTFGCRLGPRQAGGSRRRTSATPMAQACRRRPAPLSGALCACCTCGRDTHTTCRLVVSGRGAVGLCDGCRCTGHSLNTPLMHGCRHSTAAERPAHHCDPDHPGAMLPTSKYRGWRRHICGQQVRGSALHLSHGLALPSSSLPRSLSAVGAHPCPTPTPHCACLHLVLMGIPTPNLTPHARVPGCSAKDQQVQRAICQVHG